jgi:hypothetical protein
LAVEWTADSDGVINRVQGSGGVLIPITDDIRCIHLYEPAQGDDQNGLRDENRPAGRGERLHSTPEPPS